MANSPPVSIRIQPETLERIDRLARELYPSRRAGKSPNRSQVILDAIEQFLAQHESGDRRSPYVDGSMDITLQHYQQQHIEPQISENLLYEEHHNSLVQTTILEPTHQYADKLLSAFDTLNNFYRASINQQFLLANSQFRSFEELMRELASLREKRRH